MEYVILVVVLLFVAVLLVDHHQKDVEEDPEAIEKNKVV